VLICPAYATERLVGLTVKQDLTVKFYSNFQYNLKIIL
jgi:hypothetical protein